MLSSKYAPSLVIHFSIFRTICEYHASKNLPVLLWTILRAIFSHICTNRSSAQQVRDDASMQTLYFYDIRNVNVSNNCRVTSEIWRKCRFQCRNVYPGAVTASKRCPKRGLRHTRHRYRPPGSSLPGARTARNPTPPKCSYSRRSNRYRLSRPPGRGVRPWRRSCRPKGCTRTWGEYRKVFNLMVSTEASWWNIL